MANQGTQGTGKHGHKDTQEPWPHHEGRESQSHSGESSRSGGSSRSQKGSEAQSHSGESSRSSGSSRSQKGGEEQSLKEREYRDESGNVHHHTKTYEEQHGGSGGKR